jgi:hypothetical protein
VPTVSAQVPSSNELNLSELSLDIIPRSAGAHWQSLLHYGCWLLAGALLGLLVFQQRRRRPQ